jgi:hypothetical protein
MKLFTVAIGTQYEREAQRLQRSLNQEIEIFTTANSQYTQMNSDPLINGLWHKCNFANYINNVTGSVVFMDADMFTLSADPFATLNVNTDTEIAYVPYPGKWYLPDAARQTAADFHGHKINSGFLYFKNLSIAKMVSDQWQHEYLEREKLYNDVTLGTSKYEYDEWALMIALMKLNLKVEILDKKWNDWMLESEQEIKDSDSIFFQSHTNLNII